MRGTLVAELSELRGLHTKDLESIKSFITRRHEKWIPKFKEFKATFPRRLVFIGTTNQEQFLSDATGNRRFLPVEVTKVEREKITSERSQYWAEAAYLFNKTGIAWEDAEKLAVEQFERFEMTNPWQDLIEHWLKSSVIANDVMTSNGKAENITTRRILQECLLIQNKDQWNHHVKKVAEIMRKMGYESKQLRRDGVKSYFWIIKES
jgi:predicted P-loop ATPase